MTRREEIVSRITELEGVVKTSNEEIGRLTEELRDSPGDLLDRDLEMERKKSIERKNKFLEQQGLLSR